MLTIIPFGVVMHILMAGLESRGEFPLANRMFLLGSVLTLAALGIMAAVSVRWSTIDPVRGRQGEPV